MINAITLTLTSLTNPHLGDWLMGYGNHPDSPIRLSTCERMARRLQGKVPLPTVDLASPSPSPASPTPDAEDNPDVDDYADDDQNEDWSDVPGQVSATC